MDLASWQVVELARANAEWKAKVDAILAGDRSSVRLGAIRAPGMESTCPSQRETASSDPIERSPGVGPFDGESSFYAQRANERLKSLRQKKKR
jgi:hypothetical protein